MLPFSVAMLHDELPHTTNGAGDRDEDDGRSAVKGTDARLCRV